MAAIRSHSTRAEIILRAALRERGITGYRCNFKNLPGKPDIAFVARRVAVFVDGAYWHGHPDHFTFGRNGSYWDQKIRRTQERDSDQTRALLAMGVRVLRFWDFEILEDPTVCAAKVHAALRPRKQSKAGEPSWRSADRVAETPAAYGVGNTKAARLGRRKKQ